MIIRRKEDVVGTKGDASGERWHSIRLLHEEDGMQVRLTDSILEAGFEMQLWQKNHLEACYCIEGEGTVEEIDSGTVHDIGPGTLYAMNNHDRHRIKAKPRCEFSALFIHRLQVTKSTIPMAHSKEVDRLTNACSRTPKRLLLLGAADARR